MDNNILPEFDLDKTANTIGDEIAKMVIEKLIKQNALAPVVHAYWVGSANAQIGIVFCSNCKKTQPQTSKYCPDCGARMDQL